MSFQPIPGIIEKNKNFHTFTISSDTSGTGYYVYFEKDPSSSISSGSNTVEVKVKLWYPTNKDSLSQYANLSVSSRLASILFQKEKLVICPHSEVVEKLKSKRIILVISGNDNSEVKKEVLLGQTKPESYTHVKNIYKHYYEVMIEFGKKNQNKVQSAVART